MKLWEHLKVARWHFVLVYKHFSLSFSGLGAKTLLCLPLTQATRGRRLYSPEAAVALASGHKYQIERNLPEKQSGCYSVRSNVLFLVILLTQSIILLKQIKQEKKENHLASFWVLA